MGEWPTFLRCSVAPVIDPEIFRMEFKLLCGHFRKPFRTEIMDRYHAYLSPTMDDQRWVRTAGKVFTDAEKFPKPRQFLEFAPPLPRLMSGPVDPSEDEREKIHREWWEWFQSRYPQALERYGDPPTYLTQFHDRGMCFWFYYLQALHWLSQGDPGRVGEAEKLEADLLEAGWTPGDRTFPAPHIGPMGMAIVRSGEPEKMRVGR